MHSTVFCWQFLAYVLIVSIVVIGTILDKRAKARHLENRRRTTEANWLKAKGDLEKWLYCDELIRTIESPEGQYLLSIEIGAFMLYMEHKELISESDHRYLRHRVFLLSDKAVYRNPYF